MGEAARPHVQEATFLCEGCEQPRPLDQMDDDAIVMGIWLCQPCRAQGGVYEAIVAEREESSVGAQEYVP